LYPLRGGWVMKMEAEARRQARGLNEEYVSARGMYLEL
jgi:hypothetical protein